MNKHQFIYKLNPDIVTIRGDIAYDKDNKVITYNNLELDELIKSEDYKYKRASEYPSFAEQFDLLYHGGYDNWKSAIQVVKDKYPKE